MSRGKQAPQGTGCQSHWKRSLSLGLALIACPCQVPLLVGLLAGTALGGWLQQYTLVALLTMGGIFVLALSDGVKRHSQGTSMPQTNEEEVPCTRKAVLWCSVSSPWR
jgi:preprotein translocase subunit SecY